MAPPHYKYISDEVVMGFIGRKSTNNAITCFDIGCAHGSYTKLLHEKFGPETIIHAFEPNPKSFDILKSKYGHNKNVILNNAAVSDVAGKMTLYTVKESPFLTSLHDRKVFHTGKGWPPHDEAILPVETKVIALDEYAAEHEIKRIHVLKIDTEGHELAVLKGAANLFKEKKIFFGQFEYGETFQDSGTTLKETVKFLNDHGYKCCYGFALLEVTPTNLVEDYSWTNFVFMPKI